MSKVNISITRKAGSVIVDKVVRSIIINPLNGGLGKIPLSTVESQGDLIVGTGDSTVSNVPIGSSSDGDVLTRVDSAENLVAWQAPAGGVPEIAVFNARLTLESGVPVSSTDQTAKTRVFLTPYNGNRIMLNVDGAWNRYILTEIYVDLTHAQTGTTVNGSAVITNLSDTYGMAVGDEVSGTGIPAGANILTIDSPTQITLDDNATADGSVTVTVKQPASLPCDIFAQRVGANTKLRRVLWTSALVRATALTTTDGIPTLTGDATMRYVGVVATTATAGETEDSLVNRLVGNYYNRVPRMVVTCPGYVDDNVIQTYTVTATTMTPNNGGTGAYIHFVLPDLDYPLFIYKLFGNTTSAIKFGIGFDSVVTTSSVGYQDGSAVNYTTSNPFMDQLTAGLHYAVMLSCRGSSNGTITADRLRDGGTKDMMATFMSGLINL